MITAQRKYQVNLAVDGNHSVSVSSDDPAAVTEGLIWARDTYKKLVRLRQLKLGEPVGPAPEEAAEATPYQRVDTETEAPICALHEVPMIWQQGRKGYFWSCHQKNGDGSWCGYKPAKAS